MSCWTSRKISYFLLAATLVLLWVGAKTAALTPYLVALGILAADLVQTLIFYRCPHCGRLLYLRKGPPLYCHHCGTALPFSGTPFHFTCAAELNSALRQGFGLSSNRLYGAVAPRPWR